jgi:hypothetical protein
MAAPVARATNPMTIIRIRFDLSYYALFPAKYMRCRSVCKLFVGHRACSVILPIPNSFFSSVLRTAFRQEPHSPTVANQHVRAGSFLPCRHVGE